MIFKELIESVQFEEVKIAIERIYGLKKEEEKEYQKIYEIIKQTPLNSTNNHCTLHVEQIKDADERNIYWIVSYSLYRRYKQKYSLEFATIEEIASSLIVETDIHCKEEYIAHVLREIRCCQETEEDEEVLQEQEKQRRQRDEIEYCSVEEILESMDN